MVDCCRKASLKWLMHCVCVCKGWRGHGNVCVCVCVKDGEVMAMCVCVCKGWRGHGSGISEATQCTPVSHLCDGGPLAQIGCEMFIYFQHQ